MSYVITYTGTKTERMKQAQNDACEYLGNERFALLCNRLADMACEMDTRKNFVLIAYHALSFAGLQGAPARALILRSLKLRRVSREHR